MKNRLEALIILLVLFPSSFLFLLNNAPSVRATYVEGTISQDTVWYLVDSPFILSNDVDVSSGATLTIEPGTEVRFGGPFSLNIEGSIVANGTNTNVIHFTTNDPNASATWQTIRIIGAQPSYFVNCIIDYGKNGLTVDNGNLVITHSSVRHTSQNGILVNDGTATVSNDEFSNNVVTGLNVTGGTQVTITNNTFSANEYGILLGGQLTGNIDIAQNLIYNNTFNGITLAADTYSSTTIMRNNISGNDNGFVVQGDTSPDITHNYVFNNTVGIYYQGGVNHQAHFNDLYQNQIGIEISANASADASYNYWGDRSGPFHPSLNPYGKGNPVGGNGIDLEFIFFLSMSSDYNNQNPTANLWTDKTTVRPNQNVTYVGANSQDDQRVDKYFYDFGDGTNSGWTTSSLFNHTYASVGNYSASLSVIDDFNTASQNAAIVPIVVQDLPALRTSITPSDIVVSYNGTVSLETYVSNEQGPLENANVAFFSVTGGAFSPASGYTDPDGYFNANFTAPDIAQLKNIRLIARATSDGYADGSAFVYIKILPPTNVQINVYPTNISSLDDATVTVYVTNSLGEPIPGANIDLSSDNGTLPESTRTTDVYGTASFDFTAPFTLNSVNVTLIANVESTDYERGYGQTTITVQPKTLDLELNASPPTIVSEANSIITVRVMYSSTPVSNAALTVSSDVGGNFSIIAATNSEGYSGFTYTAPQTTTQEGINATLLVRATKSEFADGQNSITIFVKPKILSIQIVPQSNATYAGGTLNLTVNVKYATLPIANASVTLSANAGNFLDSTGVTDAYGNATFVFIAPQVNEQTNVTLTATANGYGYADNVTQQTVYTNPRTFSIQIISATITYADTSTLSIHTIGIEDKQDVSDAVVTLSFTEGRVLTGSTDASGTCTFTLDSDLTRADMLNLTLSITKQGYKEYRQEMALYPMHPQGGLSPLLMILLIVPIVVAVVIVVLVKKNVLVISTQEED